MTNIDKIISNFIELVEEVPFGNSDTQNRQAIVNDEKTPYRAYRHAALRVMNRLEALREANYNLRKREIEIKMLLEEKQHASELRCEMIDLEIEHKRSGDPYAKKLIADAIREIESLWPVIQSLGKVSRKEFEQGEIDWYRHKHNIAIDLRKDLFAEIEKSTKELLPLPDLRKGLLDATD